MKILLLSITLFYSFTSIGQYNENVNITELIRELQIWEKDDKEMSLTFWIPPSYWAISLKNSPDADEATIDNLNTVFKDVIFICVLDMELHSAGTMTYTSEKNLRRSISIVDAQGNTYSPLKEKELSQSLIRMSNTLKPMFAKMLGQMGEGMQFYFFEVKDAVGNNLINELKEGDFTVKHSNREFYYDLPIVELLAPKNCPTDGAVMKGNWNYCPIHGTKLDD